MVCALDACGIGSLVTSARLLLSGELRGLHAKVNALSSERTFGSQEELVVKAFVIPNRRCLGGEESLLCPMHFREGEHANTTAFPHYRDSSLRFGMTRNHVMVPGAPQVPCIPDTN